VERRPRHGRGGVAAEIDRRRGWGEDPGGGLAAEIDRRRDPGKRGLCRRRRRLAAEIYRRSGRREGPAGPGWAGQIAARDGALA
jgi:hypothetical protein